MFRTFVDRNILSIPSEVVDSFFIWRPYLAMWTEDGDASNLWTSGDGCLVPSSSARFVPGCQNVMSEVYGFFFLCPLSVSCFYNLLCLLVLCFV